MKPLCAHYQWDDPAKKTILFTAVFAAGRVPPDNALADATAAAAGDFPLPERLGTPYDYTSHYISASCPLYVRTWKCDVAPALPAFCPWKDAAGKQSRKVVTTEKEDGFRAVFWTDNTYSTFDEVPAAAALLAHYLQLP